MAKTNATIDGPEYPWKVETRLVCVTRPALALLGALKYQGSMSVLAQTQLGRSP
jgi:hypothetical protein